MDVKILPNYLIHSFFVLISLIVAFILLKTLKYPEKQNEVNKKYIFSVLLIGALIGVKLPIIISYGWHKVITGQ
jgi:L-cystine uptake protein TcyP (sodium:dicarboxylate symporter family)